MGGQAGQFGFLHHIAMPSVGGVQHVLFELGLQLRQFLHDVFVAGFGSRGQAHAGQLEVAQRVVQYLALHGVQPNGRGLQALVGGMKFLVLANLRAVFGHERHAGVVRGAQLWRIHHGIQVTDGREHTRQLLLQCFEGLHQGSKARRWLGQQGFQSGPAGGQLRPHGRLYVVRGNLPVAGEAGEVE